MFGRLRNWLVSSAVKSATGYTLDDFARRFAAAMDESDGASDSGINLSRPYMQSVWVYAAVGLISQGIANVPLRVKNQAGDVVDDSPLSPLIDQPNADQSWPDFAHDLMARLLLDGHVFLETLGMSGRRPSELRVTPIGKVTPDVRPDSRGDDHAFRWIRKQTGEPLIPGDEIHAWKLFNPYDDVYGMAPLSPGALAIYTDYGTGVYNKAFFQNGAKPGIVFSTDDNRFTNEQAKQAQERWNAAHRGARRGHQAAFIGNGLKPHLIGYTFSDMEFPELKRMSKAEILAIYHVPDTLLGAQAPSAGVSIGGTGRRPDEENFILNTIMPWASALSWFFDRTVTRHFGDYYTEFDFRQLPILQDRLLDRAKEGREWIKAGASFNDINEKFSLGFLPQPTGNDWWVPSNMLPARLLMDGPLKADPGRQFDDGPEAKDAKVA